MGWVRSRGWRLSIGFVSGCCYYYLSFFSFLESRSRVSGGLRGCILVYPFLHLSAVDMVGYDGLAMDWVEHHARVVEYCIFLIVLALAGWF